MFFGSITHHIKRVLANKFTLIGLTFCLLSSITKPSAADDQFTLVHAAWSDDIDQVRELLTSGADVNKPDNNGRTPLCWAALNGHTQIAQLLIDANANVSQADMNGWTPLTHAAIKGHTQIAQLLIGANADVNTPDNDNRTPLFQAAIFDHNTAIAQLLIAAGANVDHTDVNGWTPLTHAAMNGSTQIAQLLITAGTTVDHASKSDYTPLIQAAMHGHTETAQLLIAAGANVDHTDMDGWTPLIHAAMNDSTETAQLLIAAGALIDQAIALSIKMYIPTLLPLAIACDQAHHQKTFKALLSPEQWEELEPAVKIERHKLDHKLNKDLQKRLGITLQTQRRRMRGAKPQLPPTESSQAWAQRTGLAPVIPSTAISLAPWPKRSTELSKN